jgi:hypothetical protein
MPLFGYNEYWDLGNYVVTRLLLAPLFAVLAGAPWIHSSKRFSLRTLLIATTLIAVVLGLVVAFER